MGHKANWGRLFEKFEDTASRSYYTFQDVKHDCLVYLAQQAAVASGLLVKVSQYREQTPSVLSQIESMVATEKHKVEGAIQELVKAYDKKLAELYAVDKNDTLVDFMMKSFKATAINRAAPFLNAVNNLNVSLVELVLDNDQDLLLMQVIAGFYGFKDLSLLRNDSVDAVLLGNNKENFKLLCKDAGVAYLKARYSESRLNWRHPEKIKNLFRDILKMSNKDLAAAIGAIQAIVDKSDDEVDEGEAATIPQPSPHPAKRART